MRQGRSLAIERRPVASCVATPSLFLFSLSLFLTLNKFIPSSSSLIGNIDTNKQEQTLDQNVHITAEFPNVTDAREVENALNNLVNVASQRINR